MHAFKNIDDMYYMLLSNLVNLPIRKSRGGDMRETLCCQLALTSTEQNFVMHPGRDLSPVYASAELLWYLSRTDSLEMISHYAPSYPKYVTVGPDNTDDGAYGYRLRGNLMRTYGVDQDSLEMCIAHLKSDPDSRQAVVAIWTPSDLLKAIRRESIPCTCLWQFFVRDGLLFMQAYMRSNDAWLGFPYDVYAFTTIQRMVAGELGIGCGMYAHVVGSMHLYERDRDRAIKLLQAGAYKSLKLALVNGDPNQYGLKHAYPPGQGFQYLEKALQLEELSRGGADYEDLIFLVGEVPTEMSKVLSDAAMCCAAHNYGFDTIDLHSPLLRKAYHDCRRRRRQAWENDSMSEAGGGAE